jgi:hypothetical protein
MAASEMYDFLSTITPDYNATLSLSAKGVVSEESQKNGMIHLGVDGSEERISFNTNSIYYINISLGVLSEADSGTVFDWYNDSAKANGMQRSFKYAFGDGHTYVVRFDCKLTRSGKRLTSYSVDGVRLKVLGRIAD